MPYQLSKLPTEKKLARFLKDVGFINYKNLASQLKQSMKKDDPSKALKYTIQIKPNDVIISGTDGLFDNLFVHEILSIVQRFKMSEDMQGRLLRTEQQAHMLA